MGGTPQNKAAARSSTVSPSDVNKAAGGFMNVVEHHEEGEESEDSADLDNLGIESGEATRALSEVRKARKRVH